MKARPQFDLSALTPEEVERFKCQCEDQGMTEGEKLVMLIREFNAGAAAGNHSPSNGSDGVR